MDIKQIPLIVVMLLKTAILADWTSLEDIINGKRFKSLLLGKIYPYKKLLQLRSLKVQNSRGVL